VLLKEEEIQLLTQIGLTKTQAKIYLTLLKHGMAEARALANISNTPRPLVYRTLDELQKIGLVEREINTPHNFKATPPNFGLPILMNQKLQQYKKIQEKTKIFLQKIKDSPIKPTPREKFKLKMYEGRQRILQIIRLNLDNTQHNLNVVSTLERWLHVVNSCSENYEKTVARVAKCRIIVEKPEGDIIFPNRIKAWLEKPNFEVRFKSTPLKTNAAIFDQNEVLISFFPSKPLAEAPVLWTNHPSFISMCQDHFEKIWKTAQKYKLKVVNAQ